jgi:hypothetical protein
VLEEVVMEIAGLLAGMKVGLLEQQEVEMGVDEF